VWDGKRGRSESGLTDPPGKSDVEVEKNFESIHQPVLLSVPDIPPNNQNTTTGR
jgi:hypothetical protein